MKTAQDQGPAQGGFSQENHRQDTDAPGGVCPVDNFSRYYYISMYTVKGGCPIHYYYSGRPVHL